MVGLDGGEEVGGGWEGGGGEGEAGWVKFPPECTLDSRVSCLHHHSLAPTSQDPRKLKPLLHAIAWRSRQRCSAEIEVNLDVAPIVLETRIWVELRVCLPTKPKCRRDFALKILHQEGRFDFCCLLMNQTTLFFFHFHLRWKWKFVTTGG